MPPACACRDRVPQVAMVRFAPPPLTRLVALPLHAMVHQGGLAPAAVGVSRLGAHVCDVAPRNQRAPCGRPNWAKFGLFSTTRGETSYEVGQLGGGFGQFESDAGQFWYDLP